MPYNQRVARVSTLVARGNIELRWTDEDGSHFAPGDVDVWIEPPARTALYISKFSERVMWLGSDDIRTWVFEFQDDETSLFVADAGIVTGVSGGIPIRPMVLLALAGLTRIPDSSDDEPRYDPDRDAYVIEGVSQGQPLRLYLDRSRGLPVRVELLDSEGGMIMHSELKLSRYRRQQVRGAAPLAGALLPTLIDVYGEDVQVKLALPDPTDDDIREEYFQLDWLTERFRPDRVEGLSPLASGG